MKIMFCTALLLILSLNINTFTQTFTKVITGPFVNDGGASRSVNFIDYNGDGSLDLFVSNGKRFGQNNFMYTNSSGIFTRVFGIRIVTDSLPYDGASWADFDNDGDLDMCVVNWYDSTNMLYRNDGSNFTLLESSPVVTNRGFSETCSFGDYDNDGLVDLFVTNSAGIGNYRNRLYKNLGSGNFVSVDTGIIAADLNKPSRGVNWVDIDGDRDLDLFICCEGNQNEIMYKNNGNGYFTKVLAIPPVTSGGETWSSSWGDYDNDGDLDLFTANHENQVNNLFRNDGNLTFTKITGDTIVNDPGNYVCTGWGDYDNDGDLDMFVTQAYRTPNSPLVNVLYKNKLMESGIASFERVTTGDIVTDQGYSYGFAWGDWNGDGSLDMFTAKTYGENENNSAYMNNGNANKWLEVKCTGTITNRSAIGTKVRIKALINGNGVWQMREVDGQSGYCGQNLDLHFGLGNAGIIDSIRVEWPSGTTQNFSGVQLNRIIRIDEALGIIGIIQISNEIPENFTLYQNYPNPFNPVTVISFQLSINSLTKLTIYDILGREVSVLVNDMLKPGKYEVEWNAVNFASGIYLYSLETERQTSKKKMILIR